MPARPADVVVAVVVELRVERELDVVVLAVQRVEADLDQHRRPLGVGHVGADQPPALGVLARLRVGERVVGDRAGGDGLAVDHELQLARRRVREVRVVDLGHVRAAQREPDAAGAGGDWSRSPACRPAPSRPSSPGAPGARSRACAGASAREQDAGKDARWRRIVARMVLVNLACASPAAPRRGLGCRLGEAGDESTAGASRRRVRMMQSRARSARPAATHRASDEDAEGTQIVRTMRRSTSHARDRRRRGALSGLDDSGRHAA